MPTSSKLGILAGGGGLPALIIEACRRSGREFFVIAFDGQADPSIVADVPHAWVRVGAGGRAVTILRENGVKELVMAGTVERPSVKALRPDLWTARLLARSGAAALGDDGLLSAVVRELEDREGFRVIGADSILRGVLAPAGVLGAAQPDVMARQDIARGVRVARRLGALDVGQGTVVQQGMVLAIEATEGTDAMLARAGGLRQEGPAGVLVKVSKPGQDRRADLPTIGPETVRGAHAAGLGGIAVEAGGTLIVDREQVVAAADAAGMFVIGVPVGGDGEA